MIELNDAGVPAEPEAGQDRAGPHRWTREEAREAARLSGRAAQRVESVSRLATPRSNVGCENAQCQIRVLLRSCCAGSNDHVQCPMVMSWGALPWSSWRLCMRRFYASP